MPNPRVCCICLTADRQAMTDRAVRSFLAQTYEGKHLLIFDTSRAGSNYEVRAEGQLPITIVRWFPKKQPYTIGALRNHANGAALLCDIIAHFDSDDFSAPTRLAEQVQFLQESGADAVGYSDMLFWDSRIIPERTKTNELYRLVGREAWLHNNHKPNYALGTSLMYWRKTWERKPFPDTSKGCDDYLWVQGLKVRSVSSYNAMGTINDTPRMVAEIHGGNTCAQITEPSTDWTRVPAWDSKLRDIMAL